MILQLGNPHDSTYFTGPNAFFHFFKFSKKEKDWLKNQRKFESGKMTKNDHQGGPRMAKNTKKSILENLKNQKMARDVFGMFFVDAKISFAAATSRRWGSNVGGPGPPRSMTKVMLNRKSYRMEDLTRI